jgi:hypothetical protein
VEERFVFDKQEVGIILLARRRRLPTVIPNSAHPIKNHNNVVLPFYLELAVFGLIIVIEVRICFDNI